MQKNIYLTTYMWPNFNNTVGPVNMILTPVKFANKIYSKTMMTIQVYQIIKYQKKAKVKPSHNPTEMIKQF